MRLFIGIELPTELKQKVAALQAELKQLGVNGAWKRQDNLHLTLEFLGEIEPQVIPALNTILTQQASQHKPFKLAISGLGAFPSFTRPHTLWAGIQGDLQRLHSLRDGLHQALKDQGFVVEDRVFRPHLTLASRPQLGGIDLKNWPLTCGAFSVNEVILFESRVIDGKRSYPDLYRARLGSV